MYRNTTPLLRLVLLIFCCSLASLTHAAQYRVTVTGQFESYENSLGGLAFSAPAANTVFVYTGIIDTNAINLQTAAPIFAQYAAPYGALEFGNLSFESSQGYLTLFNDFPTIAVNFLPRFSTFRSFFDGWSLGAALPNGDFIAVELFSDADLSPIDLIDDLSISIANPDNFEFANIIYLAADSKSIVKASVDSFDVQPIPLPPSVLLFASALAGVFGLSRSRKQPK